MSIHPHCTLLAALLTGCTALIDLEGPPRPVLPIEVGDAEAPEVAPPSGPPPQDAAVAIDALYVDASPAQVIVTDLRGMEGTHDGTAWNGRALQLEEARTAGTFTSQVFEVEAPVRWHTLRWHPWLAYGKPLPDARGRDEGYPGGGVDMQGNVLLLHLDDVDFAEEIVETSGAGHAVRGSGDGLEPGQGVFGGSAELVRGDRLEVPSDHPAFRFEDLDFTWMTFVRSSACDGLANEVLMGGENPRADMGPPTNHLWLGCMVGVRCSSTRGLGGTVRALDGPTASGCAPVPYTDGRWHQVALVKTGHRPATLRWYLDGQQVAASEALDFGESRLNLDGTFPFTIGGFPRDRFNTEGALDEIALWHRALSEDELKIIAARGLGRLSVQVRACVTADCSEDPPFGPDLVDDFTATDGIVTHPIELGPSRHIQYRVSLVGALGLSPRLLRVELVGAP